ncbi:tRNA(Ile)-lysidine synthase [Tepidimonas alkaliphilus]|uniref:tRNA(Ile)-lysidine synthase n=1 Tax=Tepidimonas alkaliphilus TaxID=2588942 RepID=A0A554W4I8_9BURK|nr:tRNA lysidine(34) synthetase TilS [Tepidimonas alkaliphilus]TSE18484.1 tRNA(Ile)-lysidine synthase [Tepidimonas alkaliphilus]
MPGCGPSDASPTPRPPAPEAARAALAAWARRHADLDRAEAPLLVAFSGGADSTALLLAASERWGARVRALHVHHGLQQAAQAFAAHAQRVAAQWGVLLEVRRVQVGLAPRRSPEEAARQARYAALAQAARRQGAAAVLLAHHALDQIETVLLALTRGAGLPGLAAMPERAERDGVTWARPLLEADGRALRAQLAAAGVPWIDDPTNADPQRTRNRLRLQVLPALLEAFPQAPKTFARSARHAASAQGLLEALAAQDLVRLGEPPRLNALRALPPPRRLNALRLWLRQRYGAQASDAQWQALDAQIEAARTRGQRIELRLGPGRVCRAGDELIWTPLVSAATTTTAATATPTPPGSCPAGSKS